MRQPTLDEVSVDLAVPNISTTGTLLNTNDDAAFESSLSPRFYHRFKAH